MNEKKKNTLLFEASIYAYGLTYWLTLQVAEFNSFYHRVLHITDAYKYLLDKSWLPPPSSQKGVVN